MKDRGCLSAITVGPHQDRAVCGVQRAHVIETPTSSHPCTCPGSTISCLFTLRYIRGPYTGQFDLRIVGQGTHGYLS